MMINNKRHNNAYGYTAVKGTELHRGQPSPGIRLHSSPRDRYLVFLACR